MKLNQLILVASSSLLLFSCVSSKKIKTAQADYVTLETKYKTLEGDMSDCSTEKATLASEKAALEREIALQNTRLKDLDDQVAFLKSNYNQALKQLQDISVISASQAESIAKEKADAKAKAKQLAEFKKIMEQQSKGESGSTKLSETAAATVNAKAEAFYSAAMSQINSKHIDWIKQNAKKIFTEKMDGLAFKVMARYYGKNEGLSEEAIEGLQVLLLREAYMLENQSLNLYNKQAKDISSKKNELLLVNDKLADDKHTLSNNELDSINLLIKSNTIAVKEIADQVEQSEQSESRKMPEKQTDNSAPSNLYLTKLKLAESINSLSEAQNQQEQQMLEIKLHQQKITLLLSRMVNQVTEHQEQVIQSLK